MSEEKSEEIKDYSQAIRDAGGDVKRQLEIVDSFIENVMKEHEDYGIIPNVAKPTLFKGGAEKLAALFQVYPIKEVTYRDVDLTQVVVIPDKYKPRKR